MYIGLDFGTTNSGAAAFDGRRVRVFPIDPASPDPGVMRSTLYITREHEMSVGKEAVDTYYRQNIGRPSKMVRQYVGEIEMTFAEVGTFVRDVYVLLDELTPGRLLRSLKSGLATSYEGTTVFGRYYELEELISLFLREIRQRVETEAGRKVEGVVLGRPVNFVGGKGESDNQRAQERLCRAARMAGFDQVHFELEPVAAALHYERRVSEPQNIVVFDFGGGTLDITVMRVGEPGERRVFATGGVGIAGDIFDQRVVEEALLDHFGRGSTWGEEGGAFPGLYTDALTNWQAVLDLNRPETLRFLQLVQHTGSHPTRVRALESLLVNNYAVRMFDEVERAKIALSEARFALVRLRGEDIEIWQPVTRSQFEWLITSEAARIEACLLETVECSGLRLGSIDAVVRTGGSAQVPCFVQMLERIFGPQKVVLSDVFSSVTAGLAIRARTMRENRDR
ncbi:MAG: Hsp70 family protein [Anaerolineae bacterium]|nr:Hsp70 family protein [Anaerolineae bacterium]